MKKLDKLTEESKNDINDGYYLIPILEEIEAALDDILARIEALEK